MSRRLLSGAAAWLALAGVAEPREVTIRAPLGWEDAEIAWWAAPAGVEDGRQGVGAGEPRSGPWVVDLPDGLWMVTGDTPHGFFLTEISVHRDGQAFEIPFTRIASEVTYLCDQPTACGYLDGATGLTFELPPGWGAEEIALHGDRVRGTFFDARGGADWAGAGAAVWFLNPHDWIAGETGPCHASRAGLLCTPAPGPAAEAGLAVLLPSIGQP